ncbi:MAG: hypothetical protein EP338_12280 [Bacteroidetes bacterium]|nr:MAG: hypothetical protein EP338_12280 [Bacteroidota bacterium]
MDLHSTLPFSSLAFFQFAGLAVLFFLLVKLTLKDRLPYSWVLAAFNASYIVFLFTKPLQLAVLILYLYVAFLALRKWYKSNNVVLPMLLLALPIFGMKTVILFPSEDASDLMLNAQNIFQIAGLSYMVFKVIGLYIDERRNTEKISLLAFFNFTAFVPTLLIGPIDRFRRFEADVAKAYEQISLSFYAKAWDRLILGVLYKYIIAEAIFRFGLSQLHDDGSLLYHVSYMYTYLFYLFFDFAGYSLLAIAFGNFIGLDVPINFDRPFLSVNPKEFWKKWHKSLGDWLGDYFFKPLFKEFTSKKILNPIQRQNLALFLTFTLMGFWNGFELHYILSGMLFGLYSVVHNYYIYRCKKTKKDVFFGNLSSTGVRWLSIAIMIQLVAFSIYLFSGNLF